MSNTLRLCSGPEANRDCTAKLCFIWKSSQMCLFSEAEWYLLLGPIICPCLIAIILGSLLLSGLFLLSNPAG